MPQRNAAIPALAVVLVVFFILSLGLNLIFWLICLPFKLIRKAFK